MAQESEHAKWLKRVAPLIQRQPDATPAERVLDVIASSGDEGISKAQLTRSTQFLKHHERDHILASLLVDGLITMQEWASSTRKGLRFFATPTTASERTAA